MTQPAISIRERADATATIWNQIGHAWPSAAGLWVGSEQSEQRRRIPGFPQIQLLRRPTDSEGVRREQ